MSAAQGDRIMVKGPGSNSYVRAKVLDIVKGDYKVAYDNGKEQIVAAKFIKFPRKSPSRVTARSDSKSPRRTSRTKSPGRRKSPVRNKSVDRKSPVRNKSVERKSPSRGRKPIKRDSSPEYTPRITRSPARRSRIAMVAPSQIEEKPEKKVFQTLDFDKEMKELKEIQESATIRETRMSTKTSGPITFATITQRKSSRITTSTPKIDNITTVKKTTTNYKEEKLNEEFTPQYKVVEYLSKPNTPAKGYQHVKPKELGGWFGGLVFVLFYFTFILVSNLYYSKKIANFQLTNWTSFPLTLKTYFTQEGAYLPIGFVLLQTLLLAIPIGKLVQSTRAFSYKFRQNGLLSAILTIGGVLILHYYYKFSTVWILDHIVPMLVTGIILASVLAVILEIRAKKAHGAHLNPYGNTGNAVNDFFYGRQIAPRIGFIDVRILLLRVFCIGTILLHTLIVINNKKMKTDFWLDSSFVALCMQTIYILHILVFEGNYVTTFDYSKEGTGLMILLVYFITPYFSIITTRSLVSTSHSYPWYCLTPIVLFFLLGFAILIMSNLQKARFRLNPNDSRVYHLKTLPTMTGKKLLVSGWWGWVRHPNYLGDILMVISMTSLVGTSDFLPYFVPVLTIFNLLHRIYRDDMHCRRVYGASWDHYCSRVKHRLIRGLF